MEIINDRIYATNAELVDFFGYSKKTFHVWKSNGFEQACKEERNKYDLKKAYQWIRENRLGGDDNGISIQEVKRQREIVGLETDKKKLEKLVGDTIDKEEVVSQWTQRLLNFFLGFHARVDRLAPLLENKNVYEIHDILSKYDMELTKEFKSTGKWMDISELSKDEVNDIINKFKKEYL